jgi:hypothetical protein
MILQALPKIASITRQYQHQGSTVCKVELHAVDNQAEKQKKIETLLQCTISLTTHIKITPKSTVVVRMQEYTKTWFKAKLHCINSTYSKY